MLKISKDLFSAWNEGNILYCHWKSNEHLLPGLVGETDLDVLLSLDDKEAGEESLRKLEFLQCKSQFGSRYPGVDDWIGFDKETGRLIHIHLHYGLVTGHKGMKEYSLFWTDMALSTRVLNAEYGVYTIEPNLEVVTLYTRIGLKADFRSIICCRAGKFHLSNDVKKEIDWLKRRIDMQSVRQLLDAYYGNNADEMFELINKNELKPTDYLRLRKITESTFKKCSRVKCFMRLREISFYAYQKWGKRIVNKIRPVISKKTPISGVGISIAFIGQDGSGKSTVTSEIKKWLTWKIDADRFYLGSGDHYTSFVKKFFNTYSRVTSSHSPSLEQNTKKNTNKTIEKTSEHRTGFKQSVSMVLMAFNYRNAARHAYKEVKRAERYISYGGIALFDRFPQNQFVGIYDGPKIQTNDCSGLSRLLIELLAQSEQNYIAKIQENQPDIVFKLQLPPEESIRRKPHENFEAVSRKAMITEQLEFEESEVFNVDATQDYNEELLFVKRIIWNRLINNQ